MYRYVEFARTNRKTTNRARSPLRFLTVTRNKCSRVCVHSMQYSYTNVQRIGKEEIFNQWIRKGRERVPRLRIQPLSSSLYIQPYDRLPYKDLYTALSMLTHRWNVSLETLS